MPAGVPILFAMLRALKEPAPVPQKVESKSKKPLQIDPPDLDSDSGPELPISNKDWKYNLDIDASQSNEFE